MTAHRRPTIQFSDAPQGTCRWCGESILHAVGDHAGEINRRRRWHPECVEIYNASDPREARRIVRKRDRAICAHCQLDTKKLKREMKGRGRAKKLREQGFVPRHSLWELDHILPLIDGGSHALENLQTLCTPCHKAKTANEARERAQAVQAVVDPETPEHEPATKPEIEVVDSTPASQPPARRRKARAPALATVLDQADEVNTRIEALLAKFP
jgi:5-methylcytosine-specific restriction endonuclease McrA